MMALMLLFVASCKKTDDPSKKPAPVDPDATKVTFLDASYVLAPGDEEGLNSHFMVMRFATEGVIGEDGYLVDGSNGKVISIQLCASNVDATTFFPTAGEYPVAEELNYEAGYTMPGMSYSGKIYGSIIMTVKNGEVSQNYYMVEEGKVSISGTASNCTINMDFGEGGKYAYTGAITIEDQRPSPDDPYMDEPQTKGTITVSATDAELYYSASYGEIELEATTSTNLYAYIVGFYNPEGTVYGNYTVGTSAEDYGEGKILYSAGLAQGMFGPSYMPSLVAEVDAEGYLAGNIYFIVGGSIEITGDGDFESTGTFTSYFGSTINVNLSGETIDADAQQNIAPRRMVRRR